MKKLKNGRSYADVNTTESWSFVKIDESFSYCRKKIPEELQEKRRAHMIKMYTNGIPYSWIGKMYNLNRTHVRRIIKGLPNN